MKLSCSQLVFLLALVFANLARSNSCDLLFLAKAPKRNIMSQFETSAVLTSLQSFGVQWDEFDLLTSDKRLLSELKTNQSPRISNLKLKELEVQLEDLRKGRLTTANFHRALYFAFDPAGSHNLPLASPGSQVYPDNDGRHDSYRTNLAYILQQMPLDLLNGAFGVGSRTFLPGLLKIAEIKAEDSQSPNRQIGITEPNSYVSIVLWTGSEADPFGSQIALIDTQLPRLVVTGKRNGDRIEVSLVEALMFNKSLNIWEPSLYEVRDLKKSSDANAANGAVVMNAKRLERVFETEDGTHSISKCVRCHGVQKDFSPIPFKFRLNYEPSPGWFAVKKINEEAPTRAFGFWGITGAPSKYNSIKETRITWELNHSVERDQREITKRITNGESVRILYSIENKPIAAANWARVSQRDVFKASFFKTYAPEQVHEEALRLKAQVLAAAETKNSSETDFGSFIVLFDNNSIISFPYIQSPGDGFASTRAALEGIEASAKKSGVTRVYRLHFRSLEQRKSPTVLNPIEMKFELETSARIQKLTSASVVVSYGYDYHYYLLSLDTKGEVFAIHYEPTEF